MSQYKRKEIYLDQAARKELLSLPKPIQEQFEQLIEELGLYGFLRYPEAKKLSGYDLFEIRVRRKNIYRCIYAYIDRDIVLLSFFKKKSNRTPNKEIQKALKRKYKISNTRDE
jgi:phage-related protein